MLSVYIGVVSYDVVDALAREGGETGAGPGGIPGSSSAASTTLCPDAPTCPDMSLCGVQEAQAVGREGRAVVGDSDDERDRGSSVKKKRPMILGMVTNNIDLDRVGRFLASCRRVIPEDSEIHFMTDAPASGQRAVVYRAMGVTEYVFAQGAAEVGGNRPIIGRWPMMRDYLKQLPNSTYSKIMFADIRDSVCQTDPFARMEGFEEADEALYVFAEAAPTKRGQSGQVGHEGKNKKWVSMCFDNVPNEVYKGIVSCAGITVGGFEAGYKVSPSRTISCPSEPPGKGVSVPLTLSSLLSSPHSLCPPLFSPLPPPRKTWMLRDILRHIHVGQQQALMYESNNAWKFKQLLMPHRSITLCLVPSPSISTFCPITSCAKSGAMTRFRSPPEAPS